MLAGHPQLFAAAELQLLGFNTLQDRKEAFQGKYSLWLEGTIRAMVGGTDYRVSQFNRAVLAKRQPGSAIKPLIYAAALTNGFTPASIINDTDPPAPM